MKNRDTRKHPLPPVRELRIKPSSYQATKAELEEDIGIDATPEELAAALGRVKIVRDPKA